MNLLELSSDFGHPVSMAIPYLRLFPLLYVCPAFGKPAHPARATPSAKQLSSAEKIVFPIRLSLVASLFVALITVLYLCTYRAFSDPPVLQFDNNHSSAMLFELWMTLPRLFREFYPAEHLFVPLLAWLPSLLLPTANFVCLCR